MIGIVARLAGQSIRRQPLRSTMAILAVAAGVSLAVGVFAAQRSANDSVLQVDAGLAGIADLRVASRASHGGLPDGTVERIAAVPGVWAAVPMIHTAVLANDERGDEVTVTALGVDCRAAALLEVAGCPPGLDATPADTMAISRRLRAQLGDDGVIRTNLGRIPVRDALVAGELDGLNEGSVVVVSLARAQELFARPSSLDSVFVIAEAGTDLQQLRTEVEAAAGAWNVVGPPGTLFRGSDAFAPITAGLFFVGLIGLGVGAQLVFNAVSLSLEERRRETATLSAVGGGSGKVAAVVVTEAAALGLLGGVCGIAGALIVEGRLIADLDRFVSRQSSVQLVSHPSPWTAVACVAAGIAIAIVAAIRPARNAVRLDLGAELSASANRADASAQIRPWRAAAWATVALAGLALCWLGGRDGSLESWQVPATYAGTFLTLPVLTRAAGLGGPVLLDALRRLAGTRLTGSTAVVLARLTRQPGRTAAMTGAVAAAVSIGIVLAGFRAGMDAGGAALARVDTGDRVVVSTMPEDNTAFLDSRPSPALLQAITEHPSVATVDQELMVEIDLPTGADVLVNTVPAGPGFEIYEGRPVEDAVARGEVMIGPALARHLDARSGDTISVPGRDGFRQLTVGGIWSSPTNQGFSIATTAEQLEIIWGPQPPNRISVTPISGVSVGELADALVSADLDTDLRAWTPDELADGYAENWSAYLNPFASLQQALIVMATVAVVSTMLLVGVQRTREDGVLSAVGLGPQALAWLAVREAAAVTFTGITFGVVAAFVSIAALVQASELVTGLRIPFRVETSSILTSGLTLAVAVGLASLIPAWRTSRIEVVEALQYE